MQHQSFKTDPGLKLPPLRIDYTLSAHSAAGRAPVSSLDVLRWNMHHLDRTPKTNQGISAAHRGCKDALMHG